MSVDTESDPLRTAFRVVRMGEEENQMYQAFDSYLNRGTGHTNHDNEDKAFYDALKSVVHEDGFNADNMAEYFLTKRPEPYWSDVIDKRRIQAEAVYDFHRF